MGLKIAIIISLESRKRRDYVKFERYREVKVWDKLFS